MTLSYFRTAAAGLVFLAAALPAQPPTANKPAGPQPVVLLLDDYRIVEGKFTLNAEGNYAQAGDTKQVFPAKKVLFVATSRPEVQAFLFARSKTAMPATSPPTGFNSVAANAFPTTIQPILTNLCASCHARPDYAGAFKLKQIRDGYADAEAAQANLNATVAQIHPADPSASDLLTRTVTAHGGQKTPALRSQRHAAYERLELWAHGVTLPDGSPIQKVVPKPMTEPRAVFVSKAAAAPVRPATAAANPTDPFDPAEFNRNRK